MKNETQKILQIQVCEMVVTDLTRDMETLDGQPFNGKTVATQLGNQAAAICTLAKILKTILEKE